MRESVEEFLKEYGKQFRCKRLRANMSLLQVARRLNISQAIISHIETGRMLPPKWLEDDLLDVFKEVKE